MNCARAAELFSDYRDATLPAPLAGEIARHVDECDECGELYRTFAEITDALSSLPVPEPSDTFAQELDDAFFEAFPRAGVPEPDRKRERVVSVSPRRVAVASWFAAAAVLATVLILRPPELASEVNRQSSRAYTFVTRTYHHAERWIEDLNVLRMTVGVAFEDRIDRLNEQLRELENAGSRGADDDDDDQQSRDGQQSQRPLRRSSLTQNGCDERSAFFPRRLL